MAGKPTYLVPVDFSKPSDAAVDNAVRLAREHQAKLLFTHVITAPVILPDDIGSAQFLDDYYRAAERDAREKMAKLAKRKKLRPQNYRFIIVKRGDPALAIAQQAKKSRVSMIIMGSHGRTGLQRFMLGSVAERTLRYATCPVLIVKK
jgi:nucleotide-binding universal stress UspA family protein